MGKIIRKILTTLAVLALVALVLNLRILDKPSREYAKNFWNHPSVQWAYEGIKDRFLAVINKDISVEDVFNPNLDLSGEQGTLKKESLKGGELSSQKAEKLSLTLDKIKPEDKEELEKILKKYSE